MKTLIIDDERLARKELTKMLEEYSDIEIIGEAADAEDGKEKIEELKPELIFLDIQMPGKTGFDLLAELEHVPKVIFCTAYDEYAIQAFEVNALDYIQKPVDNKRLGEAVRKALKYKINKEKLKQNEFLTSEHSIFVKDGDKCWFVKLADVRLFESVGNYVQIFFDKNKPLIHRSLNQLTERLDERIFFRANRKQIVNVSWIESIEPYFNGALIATLKGGEKIEISRRQSVKFKDMMSL